MAGRIAYEEMSKEVYRRFLRGSFLCLFLIFGVGWRVEEAPGEWILSCCGRYAGILHGACGLSRRDRQ